MTFSEVASRASDAAASRLAGSGMSRRGFLGRFGAAAAAAVAAPGALLLDPNLAEAAACPQPDGCTSGVYTDGYSAFCCTLTGSNNCPAGTSPGGWWYACVPTSMCTAGRRYYIDCMGNCPSDCSGCTCYNNQCNARRVCCNTGYTNCGGSASAKLRCRLVRCSHPCNLWASCSCSGGKDQVTCNHGGSCITVPSNCGISSC